MLLRYVDWGSAEPLKSRIEAVGQDQRFLDTPVAPPAPTSLTMIKVSTPHWHHWLILPFCFLFEGAELSDRRILIVPAAWQGRGSAVLWRAVLKLHSDLNPALTPTSKSPASQVICLCSLSSRYPPRGAKNPYLTVVVYGTNRSSVPSSYQNA